MRVWLTKYLFILGLFASSNVLFAQTTGTRRFRISESGDPVRILTLFKNNQGYIYVGTTKGVYKFDGVKFTHIPFQNPVTDPTVTSIFQDNQNQLWVGFQTGDIAKIINNQIKFFIPEEGTPKKPITAFLQDKKKNIWFATDGEGVYYITNNHLYNIDSADGLGEKSETSVYSLILSEDDEVLAGSDQGISICKIFGANKNVKNINSKNGLPDNYVKSITPAGNNNYWIGMQDKGICLYNNSIRRFVVLPALQSWEYGQVNKLLQSQHNLWIATENSGLIKAPLTPQGIGNVKPDPEQPLNINDLLQDREGNIWLLANSSELIKTTGDQLKQLVTYKEKDFTTVHALLCDNKNNVWHGTKRGVIKYLKNGTNSQLKFTISELDVKTDITAMYQDMHNRIWIGTMGKGIFLMDENTGKYRRVEENSLLQKSSVLSITGRGNTVFVSSLEGAGAFTLGNDPSVSAKFSYSTFTNISSVGSNYIYDIFKDSKGHIWFATDGKGISVLRNDKFTNYNESHGLKDEVIYSITEDKKGNIWFSTHNAGVYKFDGKKFTNYSIANGLSDINISAVKSDKSGNILIVHKKGIDILNPVTGQVSYINSSQGIKEVNVQDLGTVSQDTAGGILVSTVDGIVFYRPLPNAIHQPQTVLEGVSLFMEGAFDPNVKHTFNYSQNSFTFSFIGIYYTDPEAVNYQYKLEGLNNEWISTKDHSVTFPKLPPGTYTFRVRSSINQLFENSNEASYEFIIETPFWTAWWFIVSCILIIGGLVYVYVKAREKSVKKVERLQQEKIQFQFETLRNQVNPHFLFNSFNTLISIIEEDPQMAVEYVEHLSDFFRNIVNYRDKDVITVKEELELLKTYFFIQQKRFGSSLALDINLTEQQKEQNFIPPLTMQLLAENAIKHNAVSKETPLGIEVFMRDDKLLVRNNINAKYSKAAGAGMGLQNIISRYTLLSSQEVEIKKDDAFFIVSLPVLKQKI